MRTLFIYSVFFYSLLFCFPSQADKIKFGVYSQEELNLKVVEFEPDAEGVVLAESSTVFFMIKTVHSKIHRRVKVLKESGKSLGDVSIRFYAKDNIEQIIKLNAQIVNIVNGEPRVVKLGKEDFYTTDSADPNYKVIKFTLPEVAVGSIIEYEYTKIDKNLTFLDRWIFQNDQPTLSSKYQIEVPHYLNYTLIASGHQVTNYNYRSKREGVYFWDLTNLRSMKEEPLMTSYLDYVEKLEFQLAGYGVASKATEVFNTWDDLGKWYANLPEMESYMKPSASLKKDLSLNLIKSETKLETAKNILEAVQKNYKLTNTKSSASYPSMAFKDFLSIEQGNRADINLAYIALLNLAEIDAYPVLISAKGNGRTKLTELPFLDQFNEMITQVNIDGKAFYLDAVDTKSAFGTVRPAFHVEAGFVINSKGGAIVPLEFVHKSGIQQMVTIEADKDQQILANTTIRYTDNDAYKFESEKSGVSDAEFIKRKFEITNERFLDFSINSIKEPKQQVDVKFKVAYDSLGEDLLVIYPFQGMRWNKNPLHAERRTFPIDFDYTFSDIYSSVIKIPEGYEIDDFPMDTHISIPGGSCIFRYKVTTTNNMISVSATTELKQSLVDPTIYEELKYLMEIYTSKLQEPVVLKKIGNPVALEN